VDALGRAGGPFVRFALFLVGLALLKGVFQFWMRVIIIGISRDIEYDLRNDLFAHLVGLSADFYGRNRTGDIMARATNDLNAVRMMLGPGVMYWTETSLTFVLAIAVMSSADWRLTLLAILPAPLVSLAVIFFGRKIHDRFEQIQALFSDISSRVQENLSGVRMVRAYVQEAAELARFNRLNLDYIAQNLQLVRISGLFEPLLEMLIGITFLIVLWAGGYRVLSGKISLGGFVMFNTYMGMLVWPMIALGWVVNLMQRGGASLDRINEILHERPSIAAPPDAWTFSIHTPSRVAAAHAPATVLGMSWNLRSRNTRNPRAQRSLTSSGPADTNSSLPTLTPQWTGESCAASASASLPSAKSSATMTRGACAAPVSAAFM